MCAGGATWIFDGLNVRCDGQRGNKDGAGDFSKSSWQWEVVRDYGGVEKLSGCDPLKCFIDILVEMWAGQQVMRCM